MTDPNSEQSDRDYFDELERLTEQVDSPLAALRSEKIQLAEEAAASGDWSQFKGVVTSDTWMFKSINDYQADDGQANYQARFDAALRRLGRPWTHLLPLWVRFTYRFNVPLTILGALSLIIGLGSVILGRSGLGIGFSVAAIVILVAIISAWPDEEKSGWLSFVTPKDHFVPKRWKEASAVAGLLLIAWWLMVGKPMDEYCIVLVNPCPNPVSQQAEDFQLTGDDFGTSANRRFDMTFDGKREFELFSIAKFGGGLSSASMGDYTIRISDRARFPESVEVWIFVMKNVSAAEDTFALLLI